MIATDFAVTSMMKNLLHEHIILLAHITFLHPLVAHLSVTLVLANAHLAATTPLLDDINQHIVLLLNHVLSAIEVDHTLILKATLTIIISPLLISLNNPLH